MMKVIFSSAFSFDRQQATDASQMFDMLTVLIYEALWGMLPIFVILLLAALVGPIGIGGWNFSTKSVQPKASRMNPLSGLKRMFSLNALVELVKGWAKVLLVGGFAFLILSFQFSTLFDMSFEATIPALAHSINILLWSFLFISLVTWLFVVLDVPYQIFQVNNDEISLFALIYFFLTNRTLMFLFGM